MSGATIIRFKFKMQSRFQGLMVWTVLLAAAWPASVEAAAGGFCGDGVCLGESCDSCPSDCTCDDENACTVDVCGPSNCCVANGGIGCDIPECQATVCAIDAFCCDVEWDDICAGEAIDLCGVCGTSVCTYTAVNCDDGDVCTTDTCDPATGCMNAPVDCDDNDACTVDSCSPSNCCVANGGLGCDNPECQDAVCAIDPFCCDTAWDGICAEEAIDLCGACGTGTCTHTPVDCDDGDACTTDSCDPATGCVYTPIRCGDGDACTDDSCDPATGCMNTPADCDDGDACTVDDCATACTEECCNFHETPGCSDAACEALVCAAEPLCCKDGFDWDPACTMLAADLCGLAQRSDCCGFIGPGQVCSDPACVEAVCAFDPFCCDTSWDTLCGIEAQELCGALCCCGGVPGGCTHTPVDCDDGDACTDDSCDPATGCVYTPVVCDDGDACTTDSCDPEPGCPDECCNVHPTPGCSDAACAALVCDSEPSCCAEEWDESCQDLAFELCGLAQRSDCCGFIGEAGCSDPACVGVVCAEDPFCCDTSWDHTCGFEAQELCADLCCCGSTGGTVAGCTYTPVDCDDGNACTTDSCDPAAGCVSTFIDGCVDLDIKPGSCPNAFRPGVISVLAMSLTGSAEFDVSLIDQQSLLLSRADGVGGDLAPTPDAIIIGDLATPFAGALCSCHTLTADGWNDLNMSFKNSAITTAFQLNGVSPGQNVTLELTGTFVDGTPFIARDCIRLQGVFGTVTITP
jgi:hypothetical protein